MNCPICHTPIAIDPDYPVPQGRLCAGRTGGVRHAYVGTAETIVRMPFGDRPASHPSAA